MKFLNTIFLIALSYLFLSACGDFVTEVEDEPPIAGFTTWLSLVDIEAEITAATFENQYPSVFEGRNDDGKIEFRVFFSTVPSDVFTYLIYYNLPQDEYETVSSLLEEQEFTQISFQTYKDQSTLVLSQSVWIRYTSAPRSQLLDNPTVPTE